MTNQGPAGLLPAQWAELMLGRALDARARDGRSSLDDLDAPIYLTDRTGALTHYNRACIDFAGRTPEIGRDRWCVTWKLYTDTGAFLPHEACPMADAIRSSQPIRGAKAIAERPDGRRVPFMPFPTPVFDNDRHLVGAINLLLELSSAEWSRHLQIRSRHCRRVALSVSDSATSGVLERLAEDYENQARAWAS